jgi:hypothetical protein
MHETVKAFLMRVDSLERALNERERRITVLEAELEQMLREFCTTVAALRPLLEENREGLRLHLETLDRSWNAQLETIQKALEQL